MNKTILINFFKGYKKFFAITGMIFLGFLVAAGVYILGVHIVFMTQGIDFFSSANKYLNDPSHSISFYSALNFDFFKPMLADITNKAETGSNAIELGTTIVTFITFLIVFASFKLSALAINLRNKKELTNRYTKKGVFSIIVTLLIGVLFTFLLSYLPNLWSFSSIIIVGVYLLITAFRILVKIKYIYFSNKETGEVISAKEGFRTLGAILFNYLIIFVIVALLLVYAALIAVIVFIPLLAYQETNLEYSIVKFYKAKLSK